MQANFIFDNVKAYDINKIDVLLGQSFKIELVGTESGVRWFSDNDPVLSLKVEQEGLLSDVEASAVGITEIQLQVNRSIVKTLFIEVFDRQTVDLGLEIQEPILK